MAQTFTDFECLLVDDGSTDDSGRICDEYAELDKRVRVFHKENGGVSSARNVGLENASGEWITFVDSDDWVEDGFLLENFFDNNSDIIFLSATKFFEDGTEITNLSLPSRGAIQKLKLCQEHLSYLIMRTPWAKLIKRCLICDIKFVPWMKIAEDTCFMLDILNKCDKICVVESGRYIYVDSERHSKYPLSYQESALMVTALMSHYKSLDISCLEFERLIYNFFLNLAHGDLIMNYSYWCRCKSVREIFSHAFVPNYSSRIRAMFAFSFIGFFMKQCLYMNRGRIY